MPLYRAYCQLDNPTVYRVFGLEAHPEDANLKYSGPLKTACALRAGPQPEAPPVCPHCNRPATFDSTLCYKYGIAGAWNMRRCECQQVHIPMQAGPSEEDLEAIESICDGDQRAHLARKQERDRKHEAKKTAKADNERGCMETGKSGKTCASDISMSKMKAKRAKKNKPVPNGLPEPPKEHTRSGEAAARTSTSQHGVMDEHRPFGMISNAMAVDDASNSDQDHVVVARPERVSHLDVDHAPQKSSVDGAKQKRTADVLEAYDPAERRLVLVLWEKDGQPPFLDRIAIPSHDKLFLFHNPRVRAIPPPTVFERYVFSGNVWSEIPWDISPIEVGPEDKIIFVRVRDVQCRAFGQHLHEYQLERGHALGPQYSLKTLLYDPPHRHRWVLVWNENDAPPHIFLFDCSLLDNQRDDVRVPRPWLKLLHDAPFLLIWHETQSRWHGFFRTQSPGIPDDAPIVLLTHPGVETRVGSGEAIAWLEKWRASRKTLAHDSASADASPARPKRPLPNALSQLSPPRTYGKKRRVSSAQLILLTSRSDDEPEFVNDAPVPSTRWRSSGATVKAPEAKWPHSTTQIVSDDEPEFVEGSSSTPMKSRKASC